MVDIVNCDEPERVFMQKITVHRLQEEKPASVSDSNDEASLHKEDALKVIPAPKNMRRSNQIISLVIIKRSHLSLPS